MAAVPQQQLAQPDFGALAGQFHAAGDQLRLCANIPAVQQGNTILDALRQIQQEMRHWREEMRDMRSENQTMHHNHQARLENSHIFRTPTEPLTPLRSLQTHDLILDFPLDVAAINQLQLAQINPLLDHLGAPRPPVGGVNNAGATLKKAIGIYGVYTTTAAA
ncbi:hypothetical protein LTR85_001803 [Meristemomyces frigidus]|nr:hypothetical protein LTR85_001803 [Meristemomyces frigidus]